MAFVGNFYGLQSDLDIFTPFRFVWQQFKIQFIMEISVDVVQSEMFLIKRSLDDQQLDVRNPFGRFPPKTMTRIIPERDVEAGHG
jgi:hypothetical protein